MMILRTSISIVLSFVLFVIVSILSKISEWNIIIIGVILLVLVGAILILGIISQKNEKKKLTKEFVYINNYICALISAIMIGYFIEKIIKLEGIKIIINLVNIYFLNYFFNRLSKKKIDSENSIEDSTEKKTFGTYIMTILLIVGLLIVIFEVDISSNYRSLTPSIGKISYTSNSIKGLQRDKVYDIIIK